ncbi:MAG: TonB-dependent receptor, partial [Pseudomonadota bacterium]
FFFSVLTPLAAVSGGIPVDPADSLISADLDTVTETENFAFYTQTRFDLNEKWTFAFGIRYDREEFFTTGAQTTVTLLEPTCTATAPGFLVGAPLPFVTIPCAALLPAPTATPDQGNTFDAVLPRGSITYNISEDHSVFVAAQRGYRAGGTFLQQSGIDTILGTFEPEFLTNVEVGFRTQWFDRRLTVNGNVFYSRLDDQQVQLPGPSGGALDFFTDNVGASDIYGLELNFDYRPTDELSFFGSLGLLDTEFDDFPFGPETRLLPDDVLLALGAAGIAPPAPTDNPFANLAGNEATLAPNVSFTLGSSYEHRSGLFADASVNFTGATESGVENLSSEVIQAELARINDALSVLGVPAATIPADFSEQSDSRTTVNARLGYKHDRFTLSVFATNLFDDDAVLSSNGINIEPDGNPLFLQTPAFTVNRPQTFGVQLDVNF